MSSRSTKFGDNEHCSNPLPTGHIRRVLFVAIEKTGKICRQLGNLLWSNN